ncbi:uncharacterized protein ACNLHF_007516 isoform 1-T3 [Anomaloglossus baeobatrachus]|uniref:uncharacterized protein LOC142254620 n=1 Tax=Anomaloglossus baeobatrachus TaxID=238106 RepID=UPI003F4FDDC3
MESQKLHKKKKKKKTCVQRRHRSQQYELGEPLTLEDMLLVCLLEDSMKSKVKNGKRKKQESKPKKAGSTLPRKVKNVSKSSQKGQDVNPDSDGKSKKKKRKKRAATKTDEICSPQKRSDISDDPFESPVKKAKKKKLEMPWKIHASFSSWMEHSGLPIGNISGGKTQKSSNIAATNDPKCMGRPTYANGVSQRGRNSVPLHQSERKFGVTNLCSEEPLDLSLPSRIRAKKNVLSPRDDVIAINSPSPTARATASKNEKFTFSFNPSENPENTNFNQILLNPDYFFKRKGESGKAIAVTPPLLTIQNGKKSHGKRKKSEQSKK